MNTVHLPRHRVTGAHPLISPAELAAAVPLPAGVATAVEGWRRQVSDILNGRDDRLLVITGPCSIDHPGAALEYAARLTHLAEQFTDELLVLMRVYVEKPRTRLGWKGLALDPHLDGTHDINAGLAHSRELMVRVAERGLPIATEFLDPNLSWHFADLVAWGAIGARTAQSPTHRHLVSALGMPVGFKNPTSGKLDDAVDAIVAAAAPHTFPGPSPDGRLAALHSVGNPNGHVVLRGSDSGPNYGSRDLAQIAHLLAQAKLPPHVIVDASHGNSGKCHHRQADVASELAERLAGGEDRIAGVMLESYLQGGRQDISAHQTASHVYGCSVTDACISWDTTVSVLHQFAAAIADRRALINPYTQRIAN